MLYLAWFDPETPDQGAVAAQFDAFLLASGLMLMRSQATRSRVYHAVKRALPPDTPLLVAPLAEPPKFKGMSPGALTWVRAAG